MKIVAVSMLKGGVGKTQTASNIAGVLASRGERVVVVDSDAQCNLSTGLGVQATRPSIVEALLDGIPFSQLLVQAPPISVIPAVMGLRDVEKELFLRKHLADPSAPAEHRAPTRILARRLAELEDDFDYAIIDCPPSLDLLTASALVAADICLVPCQTAKESLEGLIPTVDTHRVLKGLRPRRLYILRTFVDKTVHSREAAQAVAEGFPAETLHATIKTTVAFKDAASTQVPLTLWRPASDGAQCYFAAVDEILRREAGEPVVEAEGESPDAHAREARI